MGRPGFSGRFEGSARTERAPGVVCNGRTVPGTGPIPDRCRRNLGRSASSPSPGVPSQPPGGVVCNGRKVRGTGPVPDRCRRNLGRNASSPSPGVPSQPRIVVPHSPGLAGFGQKKGGVGFAEWTAHSWLQRPSAIRSPNAGAGLTPLGGEPAYTGSPASKVSLASRPSAEQHGPRKPRAEYPAPIQLGRSAQAPRPRSPNRRQQNGRAARLVARRPRPRQRAQPLGEGRAIPSEAVSVLLLGEEAAIRQPSFDSAHHFPCRAEL
jgi:hypothetical protein